MKDIDYGPLERLIGTWKGELGQDRVPKTYGEKTNLYREVTKYTKAGQTENIDVEVLRNVRYHTEIQRINDGKIIHDQVGYLIWIPENDQIIHSFTIPRGTAIVAGGSYSIDSDNTMKITVEAELGSKWEIAQSQFLSENSKIRKYYMEMSIKDDVMDYVQHSYLEVFGKDFDHKDQNTLKKM
ncbi:MAG: heme-binding beta-barrel domain-containing protein [Flavobacteriaceae bacterium]